MGDDHGYVRSQAYTTKEVWTGIIVLFTLYVGTAIGVVAVLDRYFSVLDQVQ